jgi:hypothetical protein
MRQLDELGSRLAAAGEALADALAAMKQAEEAFDAASDASTQPRLPSARPVPGEPGRERSATRPRQAHKRASTNGDRLQRRVRDLPERVDRMQE